jgi:hypothetical protein
MAKLLQFLSPWVNSFEIPERHFKVWPFYQSVSRIDYKTDAFDNLLICNPVKDLLKLPNHKKTFEQICLERAEEIKQLSGPIYVMWSGGIDSTAILAAIFRTFNKHDLERLTVLCNDRSIKENATFFKLIIKNNVKVKASSANLEQYLHNGWMITGELGDQLFGQDMIVGCVALGGEEAIHDSWEKHVPRYFEHMKPGGAKYINEVISPIIHESPFPIKSTHDFAWWYNFTQKWQHVKLRFLSCNTWKDPKNTYSRMIHFYDSIDFELWSIHNHELKIDKTLKSYKSISKEFSIKWSGDADFMNKEKEISAIHLFLGYEFNWAIDEHWNFLTKEEALAKIL